MYSSRSIESDLSFLTISNSELDVLLLKCEMKLNCELWTSTCTKSSSNRPNYWRLAESFLLEVSRSHEHVDMIFPTSGRQVGTRNAAQSSCIIDSAPDRRTVYVLSSVRNGWANTSWSLCFFLQSAYLSVSIAQFFDLEIDHFDAPVSWFLSHYCVLDSRRFHSWYTVYLLGLRISVSQYGGLRLQRTFVYNETIARSRFEIH